MWTQNDVDLSGKPVAVKGTGASGVQIIQEIARAAEHLTVYRRTPNTSLPMQNQDQATGMNEAMRDGFSSTAEETKKTLAGFDYDFSFTKPMDVPKEERTAFYQELYSTGGLPFWLSTNTNVLFEPEANEEAYYWRARTLPRIKDPSVAEILCPEKKHLESPWKTGTSRSAISPTSSSSTTRSRSRHSCQRASHLRMARADIPMSSSSRPASTASQARPRKSRSLVLILPARSSRSGRTGPTRTLAWRHRAIQTCSSHTGLRRRRRSRPVLPARRRRVNES